MTNYLKTAYDDLISLIKTQYPRFKDPDRLQIGIMNDDELEIEKSVLGYEDCMILFTDDITETTSMILTSGKSIVEYMIKLLYYKPKLLRNQLSDISNFAEGLENWLKENYTHRSGKWILLNVETSYSVPKPPGYDGTLTGFLMTINFTTAKY